VRSDLVHFATPKDAQQRGIGTVFQELSLVPSLSVSENIFPNRAPVKRGGFIRWSALHKKAQDLMAQFGVKIDVKAPVDQLTNSTRQVVEIAKALSLKAQIILLDEPTSALGPDEVDALFGVIRRLKTLAGVLRPTSGAIRVEGRTVRMHGIADAIKLGIAYLPAERKTDGLFLENSIGDNMIAATLAQFSKYGFLDRNRRKKISEQYIGQLNVRISGVHQLTGRLSGGNQQKVMIAKWLIMRPRILIVDEPTKGVDVGAKYEIHALLRSLADHAATIVVISSDLPEILGLSDRIVVMA
jgi:ABC-type sugar transport system ATPase subunit